MEKQVYPLAQQPLPMASDTDDEINLLDLLLVLAKHNRFIIRTTVAAAVLSVGFALMQPNIYTAKTVIMPPQQGGSSASMLLGSLGGLAGGAGAALGLKNPSDLYVAMLKSRTVTDSLIMRFGLMKYYQAPTLTVARSQVAGALSASAGKDGFITIEFSDQDPKLAAEIANAYVEELRQMNKGLAVTEAGQRRLFFEQQLKQAKDNLATAEEDLKTFQQKSGLLQPEAQGAALMSSVAKLRAEIAAKEVELSAMRSFATEQNPAYRQAIQVLSSLRAQLTKLQQENNLDGGGLMSSTANIPEAGLTYLRKMRELKYQETLFELLSKQYEMARIDEAKDATLIQVVDKAVVPEQKSKPKRALICIVGTMLGLFLAVLLAFLREARARVSADPAQAERVSLLGRYLRHGR